MQGWPGGGEVGLADMGIEFPWRPGGTDVDAMGGLRARCARAGGGMD